MDVPLVPDSISKPIKMSLVTESFENVSLTVANDTHNCTDQDQRSTDESLYSKSDSTSESERSLSIDGSLDDLSRSIVNSTRDLTGKDQLGTDQSFHDKSDRNNNGTQFFHNSSLAIYNVSTMPLALAASSESQTVCLNQICQPDLQQIETHSLMLLPSAEANKYPMLTDSLHLPGNTFDEPSLSPNTCISENGPMTESSTYLVNQNTTDDRSCMTRNLPLEQSQSNAQNLPLSPPLQFNVHQILDESLAKEFLATNAMPTREVQLFVQNSESSSLEHELSDLRSITGALSVLFSLDPSILDQVSLPPPTVDVGSSSPEILDSTSRNPLTCEIPLSLQDPQPSSDYSNESETIHVCPMPDCGRVFDRSWMLKRHLTTHNVKNEFYCAHCDEKFVCKDTLAVHVQDHMNDENKELYTDKPRYVCHIPDCGQVFNYESNLKWHLDWHSDKKKFFCAHCDKGFMSKNALALHVKKHMNTGGREKCQYPSSMDYEFSEVCQVPEPLPEISTQNKEESVICITSSTPAAKNLNPAAGKPYSKQTPRKTRFKKQDPLLSSKPLQTLEDTPGLDNTLIPEEEIPQKEEPTNIEDPGITADFLLSELCKSFPCEICKKRFARRYELRAHMNMHKNVIVPNPFYSDKPSSFIPLKGIKKRCNPWTRCMCPNCSAEGDNKVRAPDGRLMHVCHISHCGRVFAGTDSLKRHLNLHKKNNFSKYVCRFSNCNKVFSQPRNLELHEIWHSGEKNFFCAHCNKGFSAKVQLVSHSKLHMTPRSRNSRGLQCKIELGNETSQQEVTRQIECLMPGCGRVFNKIRSLKTHLRAHSNEKKFICTHCNEAFPLKVQLVLHTKTHMNPESGNFQDLNCKAEQICHYCGRAYWQEASLTRHIRQMHGEEENKDNVLAKSQDYLNMNTDQPKYICPVTGCGRSFSISWVLKRHLKDHSDENNFFCAYCKQGFARKVQLALHMKSHMNPRSKHYQGIYSETKDANESNRLNDKPQHACHIPNCSRVFWHRYTLVAHLRKFHSGEGNIEPIYACQVPGCERAFSKVSQLERHMKSHATGKEKFICAICDKEFTRRDIMQKHMKEHMPDSKKYICNIPGCESVYYKPSLLERHLEWHNGKKFTRKPKMYKNIKQEKLKSIKIESKFSRTPSKPKRASCNCPNCSVEGGNKTPDSTGRPLHICHHPDCGKVFYRPGNLNWHLVLHTDKKNFVRPKSNKRFARKDALVENYQIPKNLKQKKFRIVKIDSKVSRTSTMLKRTNCKCPNCSINNGNKTKDLKGRLVHICHYPGCGKIFCRESNLKRHLKWHNGRENFFCAHCPKGFTLKSALSRHVTLHMNEQFGPQYACHIPGCGRVYNLDWKLKKHLTTHDNKKEFFCAHRNKRFTRKDNLKMHLKVHETPKRKNLGYKTKS